VVDSTVPTGTAILYSDEWSSYRRVESELSVAHSTVRHGRDEAGCREWARDDNGDSIREVHGNSREGADTGLHTDLRVFRGVYKRKLKYYVATYEAMTNAKRISSILIRQMCRTRKQMGARTQTDYT
jgi:hypothetical protein